MAFDYIGCARDKFSSEPLIIAKNDAGKIGRYTETEAFDLISDTANIGTMVAVTNAIGMLHNNMNNNVFLQPIDSVHEFAGLAPANKMPVERARSVQRGSSPFEHLQP